MVILYPKILSSLFHYQIQFLDFSIFTYTLLREALSQEYRAKVNIYWKGKLYFSYLKLRVHLGQIQFVLKVLAI